MNLEQAIERFEQINNKKLSLDVGIITNFRVILLHTTFIHRIPVLVSIH